MPKAMSTRFIVLVWWLFVVVILATYSGNLIAFLTVTKVTLPVSSLSDVAAQSNYKFGTVKSSALWNLFETSKTGAPKRFWEGMDKVDQPSSYGAGTERVLTGMYKVAWGHCLIEKEDKKLRRAATFFFPNHISIRSPVFFSQTT